MKRVGLFLLFVSALSFAQSQCLDNCDQFGPECAPCHFRLGRFLFQAEGQIICEDCDYQISVTGTDLLNRVMNFIKITKYPKSIDPELHLQLMERAFKSGKDGAELGRCIFAFRNGTRERLQAEIQLTRQRLLSARTLYIK